MRTAIAPRSSPWWPSSAQGRVFLVVWLLLNAAIILFPRAEPILVIFSTVMWYFIIAGMRALMYPARKRIAIDD